MDIDMNYEKIYNSIIEKRQNIPIDETEYGELHHIIPRSLGGSDDEKNIIKLTAREHFICHYLLTKMYKEYSVEWYKMNHAFMFMKANADKRYINSRLYESKKKNFSSVMSYNQRGERNSNYGKTLTESQRRSRRNAVLKYHGVTDGLTAREREKINKALDRVEHTINDKFISKLRRNKILEIFNINLNNRCKEGYAELKNLLYTLYVIDKKSTLEIAQRYNTNDETIRNYLLFLDIPRRTLSAAVKNYIKNH